MNATSEATFPTWAGYAMALKEAQDLHLLRELDKEFLIPFEMMNLSGIAARELAHGCASRTSFTFRASALSQ